MKLLRQKGHKCVLYSAAMVLDIDPEILEKELGHDGLAVQYPDLPEPSCFRSHHMQEILDSFISRGYGLMLIELMPRSGPQGRPDLFHKIFDDVKGVLRFLEVLKGRHAILIGQNPESGGNHAYAWDGSKVFDPLGRYLEIDKIPIREAWIVVNL